MAGAWDDFLAGGAAPGGKSGDLVPGGAVPAATMDWGSYLAGTPAANNTEARGDYIVPMRPYGPVEAAMRGATLGTSDVLSSLVRAGGRAAAGQGFDYPQAARETERGPEAYAGAHPYLVPAPILPAVC